MTTPLTCPEGHQWDPLSDAAGETDRAVCPRCGSPPLQDNLDGNTTLPPLSMGGAFHGRETTIHGWLYDRFFVPHFSAVNASLAFAFLFVFVIFVLLWPFYRGKLFLRV